MTDWLKAMRLRNLLRLGVRQKVLLVLLTTLLVTLTVSTWMTLKAQQTEILNETNRRGSEITHFLAQYLAYSVVGHDYHTIELLLGQLATTEDIVHARVVSAKGNVMAEIGQHAAATPGVVSFHEDIRLNNEVVGKLQLGLSTERIIQGLDKQRTASIERQLIVILTITLVELLALSYIIIRPITTISRVLGQSVTTDGAMVAPIPIQSDDEFGDVARQFNQLREQLNNAHARLQSKIDLTNDELHRANQRLIEQADELRHMNHELQRLTITDPLTGLYNRRHFEQLMQTEVELSIRNGDTNSIILLDIDHFKDINDRFGHDAGDAILGRVALAIQSRIRKTDVACRFGGDEFFILCRRAPIDSARAIAENLREKLAARKQQIGELEIGVTLSIGVATIPCDEAIGSAEAFFKCADIALYQSKHAGRNCVTHYSALSPAQRKPH